MASILLVIIYIAFISLGLPDSLLGSAWPVIYKDLNIPISSMGMLTMLISFGTITSSLFASKLNHKFGSGLVTSISVFLTAIAMFGFSISNSLLMLSLFAFPYGFGAGAIDSTLNNYVSLHYKKKHMNFLHAFWGIGTLVGPFAMSYAISNKLGWQKGYEVVAMIQLVISLIVFGSLFMWKKQREEQQNEQEHLNIFQVLKIKHIKYLMFAFLLYTGFEATMFNWVSTYLVKDKGISEDLGALLASIFFIGMTVGRIISGILSNKVKSKHIIRIGFLLIITGMIVILFSFIYYQVAVLGIIIAGLGAAPIFPSIIHRTPSLFDRKKSQAIISIEMFFAYSGVVLMPAIFGLIANYVTIQSLPLYILIIIIISFILLETLNKKVKNT
ncbi:MFS transporter [Acholeplasma hippikon]|uniref:Inner membrane protein ybjJ n=1 Tax=Acholeplasma hippikon TaxID=264636 RepID=A0A449BIW2_9MOLU|nr:MFS transporter [Acholeplasma hippikon]VEU82257.1 Inner membrane protein ybjJ [Acholeplasma hippikon]